VSEQPMESTKKKSQAGGNLASSGEGKRIKKGRGADAVNDKSWDVNRVPGRGLSFGDMNWKVTKDGTFWGGPKKRQSA